MKLSENLTCAIIGTGPGGEGRGGGHSIGYAHAWAVAKHTRTTLVAAAARRETHRETFGQEFPDATLHADYTEMLRQHRPAMVSVCAFPQDRCDMVEAALAAGARIVWVEKPFALSAGEGRRMITAAASAKARLFVNHQRRYGRPFVWARDVIADGRIGRVRAIDIAQPFPGVVDFGIHLLDMAAFLTGIRGGRFALAANDMTETTDYKGLPVAAHLLGAVHLDGEVRLGYEAGDGISGEPVLRVTGEAGRIEVFLAAPGAGNGIVRLIDGEKGVIESPEFDEHFHHGETEPQLYYDRALADLLTTTEKGLPCRIDAGAAMSGIEWMTAIGESAARQSRVTWPLSDELRPWRV
jgi:predicted dehydrogenase